MMPPGGIHRFAKYRDVRQYALYFRPELLTKAETSSLRGTGLWNLLIAPTTRHGRGKGAGRLHLQPEQYREAEAMIAEIYREMQDPPMGAILARHGLFRLLATLARRHDQAARRPVSMELTRDNDRSQARSLQEIIEFCERNFQQPLTVNQLASRMFLSPAQFTQLFKRATGMPPAGYLHQLRLAHAQRLLTTTTLSNGAIAAACGLRDGDQLSRVFRRTFGTTPSQYRRG
jgi:AraC-like DNA-binding protein